MSDSDAGCVLSMFVLALLSIGAFLHYVLSHIRIEWVA